MEISGPGWLKKNLSHQSVSPKLPVHLPSCHAMENKHPNCNLLFSLKGSPTSCSFQCNWVSLHSSGSANDKLELTLIPSSLTWHILVIPKGMLAFLLRLLQFTVSPAPLPQPQVRPDSNPLSNVVSFSQSLYALAPSHPLPVSLSRNVSSVLPPKYHSWNATFYPAMPLLKILEGFPISHRPKSSVTEIDSLPDSVSVHCVCTASCRLIGSQ